MRDSAVYDLDGMALAEGLSNGSVGSWLSVRTACSIAVHRGVPVILDDYDGVYSCFPDGRRFEKISTTEDGDWVIPAAVQARIDSYITPKEQP